MTADSTGDTKAGTVASAAPSGSGVRVFVRLRPPAEESSSQIFEYSPVRPRVLTIKDPLSAGQCEHTYEFSGVFKPQTDQESVFGPVAGPVVDAALRGHSGCVIAYGQTGAGKTYSIFGKGNATYRGLLPRAAEKLLLGFGKTATERGGVTVSFLELYVDQIRDLGRPGYPDCGELAPEIMSPSRSRSARPSLSNYRGLEIRDTPNSGVHVRGLARVPVRDFDEVRRVIQRGLAARATAATAANLCSSRSHTIFTLHFPRRSAYGDENEGASAQNTSTPTSVSTLSFVDLAGSERIERSKADGARFQEAVAINTSLTALGKVILALASGSDNGRHVPYRDSKLTRLLSPSFGSNTQISLLACVHPAEDDYEESLNTLFFADRCKNVCKPGVNSISQGDRVQMRVRDLEAHIAELKAAIRQQETVAARPVVPLAVGGNKDKLDAVIAKVLQTGGPGEEPVSADVTADPIVAEESVAPLQSATCAGEENDMGATMLKDPQKARIEKRKRSKVLKELQEERAKQARAQEEALMRIDALDRERKLMSMQEEARQKEMKDLKRRGAELQDALKEAKAELEKVAESAATQHGEELARLHEDAKKKLQDMDETLFRIPAELRRSKEARSKRQLELRDARAEMEQEQLSELKAVKRKQGQLLEGFTAQWRARVAEAEARHAELSREGDESREREQRIVDDCQKELVALFEIAAKLTQVMAVAEDGQYTVMWRGGQKEVIIPSGTRPQLPTPAQFPQLFDALDKAEQKVSSLERRAQRPVSASRLRHTVAAASGRYDSVDFLNDEAIGACSVHEESSDLGESGMVSASGSTAALQRRNADAAPCDAAECARSLCEAQSRADGERLLVDLDVDQLRQLCMQLRKRSLSIFAPGAEREALKREAVAGLEDEATTRYVQELERRRDEERSALAEAVERAKQLRKVLEGRRGTLFSSRPSSALVSNVASAASTRPPSRSTSRPQTPSSRTRAEARCGSGLGSRPASRPPLAARPPALLSAPARGPKN